VLQLTAARQTLLLSSSARCRCSNTRRASYLWRNRNKVTSSTLQTTKRSCCKIERTHGFGQNRNHTFLMQECISTIVSSASLSAQCPNGGRLETKLTFQLRNKNESQFTYSLYATSDQSGKGLGLTKEDYAAFQQGGVGFTWMTDSIVFCCLSDIFLL